MAKTQQTQGEKGRNRRRSPIGVGSAVVLFIAILVAIGWLVPLRPLSRDELTVVFLEGGGRLQAADGSTMDLSDGTAVRPGDRVELPAGAVATFAAADGHRLTVTDASTMTVNGSKSTYIGGRVRTQIDLEQGEMRVSGEHEARTSLDIGLPNGTAGVRGTDFSVAIAPGQSAVSVHSGSVGLSHVPGGKLDLSPGDGAVVSEEGTEVRRVSGAPTVSELPAGEEFVRAPGSFLRWSAVFGADRYQAQFATDSSFLEIQYRAETEGGFLELPVLDLDTTMYVRVQAVSADGIRGFPSTPYRLEMAPRWAHALALRDQGDLRGSLEEFQATEERFSDNPYLLRDLGWAYYLLGRYPDAREVYEHGRDLAPTYADLLVELGRVYFWLGQRNLAEATYQDVLSREPENAHALWGLGDLYRTLGRHREALELVRHALRVDPNHPYARTTLRQLGGD